MRRGLIDIPVRRFVRSMGFDVERKRPVLIDLLRRHCVDTVLDVGANIGQYARRLRAWGYRGRIISFEPVLSVARVLAQAAADDPLWTVCEFALGDEDREDAINVSGATVFSSIRTGRPTLHDVFVDARPVGREPIVIRRLDTVFSQLPRQPGAVFLKIDTQGYEREVLRGAELSLASIAGAQIEVSLTSLYEGEATLVEIMSTMEASGFSPVLMEPVAYDARSQALLQIDCVFFRVPLAAGSSSAQGGYRA